MSRRRIFAITVRLLTQFRRDRRTVALLLVAPIVLLSLFGYLIRGTAPAPKVGIDNQDTGPLGASVTSALTGSSTLDVSTIRAADGDAKLKDGTLVAYVVLAPDFSSKAASGDIAPKIHLEGSQPTNNQKVIGGVQAALAKVASSRPGSPKVAPEVIYVFGGSSLDTLDYFGAAFIGLIVFFLIFVITIVSFLNERSQGTLERLMATPLRRGEIVVGYMLGFGLLALVQAVEVLLFALYVLKVHNQGNVGMIFGVEALMALSAVNLGIFLSMFARSEFQAVQFIPLVIVPQFILSGIVFPVSGEPLPLQYVSNVLPLTYGVAAMRSVMLKGADLTWPALQLDTGVVAGFCALLIVAAVLTLRRRIA